MKLRGRITISRVSGSGDDFISIEVTDDASGVTIVDAQMSLEAFGKTVTGCGFTPCELRVGPLEKVGLKHEHKREEIQFNPFQSGPGALKAAAEVCVPFEVDGWKARSTDALNSHNIVKGTKPTKVRVTFDRWVKP